MNISFCHHTTPTMKENIYPSTNTHPTIFLQNNSQQLLAVRRIKRKIYIKKNSEQM